jgi:hypothetical protein
MDKRYSGVTLIFSRKEEDKICGLLKSYVLKVNNIQSLRKEIKIIVNNQISKKDGYEYKYYGINDLFAVSGKFAPKAVLGKSFLDEVDTIESARELINSEDQYSCNNQKDFHLYKEMWFLVSLIFFYFDKKLNDSLSIACSTPVHKSSLRDVVDYVNDLSKDIYFHRKIVSKRMDKLKASNLTYVGIENINLIEENPIKGESFQTLYNDFITEKELKSLCINSKEVNAIGKEIWR